MRSRRKIWGGWDAFRYGSAKKITVASPLAPSRLLKGEKRAHVVSEVLAILKTGRLSPFEHEAACRHGVRVSLVSWGARWSRADADAAAIVEEALRRNGVLCRPTWAEGQREYVEPRENCRACGKLLPDDLQRGGAIGFCDEVCAKSFIRRREEANGESEIRYFKLAARAARRFNNRTLTCAKCAMPFRPFDPEQIYCSRECSKYHRLKTPDITCKQCGVTFRPRTGEFQKGSAKYCSIECKIEATTTIKPRNCKVCGTSFRPQKNSSTTCSNKCRVAYGSAGKYPKTCKFCQSEFLAANKVTVFCSREHGTAYKTTLQMIAKADARGRPYAAKSEHAARIYAEHVATKRLSAVPFLTADILDTLFLDLTAFRATGQVVTVAEAVGALFDAAS